MHAKDKKKIEKIFKQFPKSDKLYYSNGRFYLHKDKAPEGAEVINRKKETAKPIKNSK